MADGLVRGAAVRLESTWQEIRARRSYPARVESLLGEMSAGAVLLASSIKFDGSLVMQMMGEGALRMAVAECMPGNGVRATAKWQSELESMTEVSLDTLLGTGLGGTESSARFVITLDPANKQPGQQPYQGVVALEDEEGKAYDSLAAILQNYMLRSEQLETQFVICCDDKAAVGMMIQRMPHEGGSGDKAAQEAAYAAHESASHAAFEEAAMKLATLKSPEQLEHAPEELVYRLFWEQSLQAWHESDEPGRNEGKKPHFSCTCSREKVSSMLKMLGRAEVESILSERERVEVGCDFCGKQYEFDAVEAAQIFIAQAVQAGASGTMQ
jgi:molecular chaperone Hsp33